MDRKDFIDMYTNLVKQVKRLNEKSLRQGIISLEEEVEDLDDENFKQGLYLIIDGVDPAIIDEIFSNKIAFEKDEYARQYKTVIKRALLGIQSGLNNHILYMILRSYADLTSKEINELDRLMMRD
jgi:flagellar motor component MotA